MDKKYTCFEWIIHKFRRHITLKMMDHECSYVERKPEKGKERNEEGNKSNLMGLRGLTMWTSSITPPQFPPLFNIITWRRSAIWMVIARQSSSTLKGFRVVVYPGRVCYNVQRRKGTKRMKDEDDPIQWWS